MRVMLRSSALVAALALLAAGCTPTLADTPFACDSGGACPEGFSCQSSICVRDGVTPAGPRPIPTPWITSGEMNGSPPATGGPALVVDDGFPPGSRGLYE